MTDTLMIRTAIPEDFAAVNSLFARSYPALLKADYPPSVVVTAVPLIARAQPQLLASGMFFVAEAGPDILGAGGWSLTPPGGRPDQRGVGHVRHVVTDHRHVRRDIGRQLMTRVMLHAKGSGMAQLRCQSTLTAVPFYAALGFSVQGKITVELTRTIDFPAVAMLVQL